MSSLHSWTWAICRKGYLSPAYALSPELQAYFSCSKMTTSPCILILGCFLHESSQDLAILILSDFYESEKDLPENLGNWTFRLNEQYFFLQSWFLLPINYRVGWSKVVNSTKIKSSWPVKVLFCFRAGNFIEMYSAKAVSATENNYCVKMLP